MILSKKHILQKKLLPFISFFILIGCINPFISFGQENSLYPSLSPGIKAPAIKAKDTAGKAFRLSKVKSRYTLLYFYEVHCHLCAVVTPELKKLYDSYHKIGLEVVAIPVESDKDEWNKYVIDEHLNWLNIFPDPGQLDKLRSDYKLTVSPTMYLLDRKKIVLTQRLGRIEHLEAELNQRIR